MNYNEWYEQVYRPLLKEETEARYKANFAELQQMPHPRSIDDAFDEPAVSQVLEDRIERNSRGGMKYDDGKVRMELLLYGMPKTLTGIGEVLTFGATKYAPHSWKSVPDGIARYEAAAMRHKLKRLQGEVYDPESGLPHIMHELTNLAFVAELTSREST